MVLVRDKSVYSSFFRGSILFLFLMHAACGGGSQGSEREKDSSVGANQGVDSENQRDPVEDATTLGVFYEGMYHLGPVDFTESEWHNACASPGGYREELYASVGLGGEYLAGVSHELSQRGGLCGACLLIETEKGKSIVARIVTYGTEEEPGDIDVSPNVYAAINEDEWPRTMQWSLARCPDAGNIQYEFQSEANPWWTSLWVRNARVPIERVEVKKGSDSEYRELERGTDGSLTDAAGFGEGAFTLRIVSLDGQIIEHELPGFEPASLVDSGHQFD